ncbi:uncharacterized protein LOC128958500 [Oppia nitens]|uniref:uncharacterized protein LOC128958500 n=1 Tax=Oppia nitens TaxID=1686743 RepID=UPI0023D9CB58|nr:uncharacterized protein LOC128958500 [Oppia nitens]
MSESVKPFEKSDLRVNQQEINSLQDLNNYVNIKIDSKNELICQPRIKLHVSRGVWRSDKKLIEVIQSKGINTFIGLTIDSVKYLEPFEALFLMESQSLEVLFEDIPLSIEESYKMFLQNESQFDLYRIYSYLSRSGYFVKRRQLQDNCSQEKSNITTLKRQLSDADIDDYKRLNVDLNSYELSSEIINNKVLTNIRQINNHLLPKHLLSQISSKKQLSNETNKAQKSLIYDIKYSESSVELNSSLVLYNKDIKPLCDLGSIMSSTDLFALMQSFGPKTKTIYNTSKDRMKYDYILDVYKQSNKRIEKEPYIHVIVTRADQKVAQMDDIICLKQMCSSNELLFAVISSNDMTFYSVSQMHLNDEWPQLWQKYFK